jgi:hypothetical protein
VTQEQIVVLLKEEDTNLTQIPNPLYRFNFLASGGISTQDWALVNQGFNVTVRAHFSGIAELTPTVLGSLDFSKSR